LLGLAALTAIAGEWASSFATAHLAQAVELRAELEATQLARRIEAAQADILALAEAAAAAQARQPGDARAASVAFDEAYAARAPQVEAALLVLGGRVRSTRGSTTPALSGIAELAPGLSRRDGHLALVQRAGAALVVGVLGASALLPPQEAVRLGLLAAADPTRPLAGASLPGDAQLLLPRLSLAVTYAPSEMSARAIRQAHWTPRFLSIGLAASLVLLAIWTALAARHAKQRLWNVEAEFTRTTSQVQRDVGRLISGLPATAYRGELFPDGSLLLSYMSANVERLTGFTWHELAVVGAWQRQVPEHERAGIARFRQQLLAEGEAVAEYRFDRKDGTHVWLRDRARVSGRADTGFAEVTGFLTDISEERSMAEQAIAAGKLATLGEMASGLAHEMSQPLATIILAAEGAEVAIETGAESSEVMARLERIRRQAERARSIVQHLRVFSRSNSGEVEPVSLQAALDGAMILAEAPLRMAGVQLKVDLPPELPLVRGQKVLIEQVLLNLIMNARDAMLRQPEAQRRLHIEGAAGPSPDLVVLRVRDWGHGFAPGVLERIFEPFFTTRPAGQGTGLGLSICHGIMRSIGGWITAHNAEPGAELTLHFQAAKLESQVQHKDQ
jgi:PAS domain S-box-containing protein